MNDTERLQSRLDALEMHAANQSQVIDDLNATVAAQWAVLDGLRRQLGQLTDRLEDAETRAGLPAAQRPPHY